MTTSETSSATVSPTPVHERDRRLRGLLLLLAACAAVVLFHGLGSYRTLGSHEAFAVVPARAMLQTGDWVVPSYGGLPRLKKPPLVYWVAAASGTVCGGLNEASARLPAAVSALLLALLVGAWAWKWYGRAAGIGAAVVQSTSVYVLDFGRRAEVDMLLCLLTTAATYLAAHTDEDRSRRRAFLRWSAVGALLSLSFLAKFHYGPAMVLLPFVVYALVQRRFRLLWNLANPVAIGLALLAVCVWPYLVLQRLPEAWEVWREQTVGRALGELETRPWWYYGPHLLGKMLPWTPLVLAAVPRSLRRAWREGDPREQYLWVWFGVQLAIVTASANKHSNYLFATLPLFALLAGQTMARLVAYVQKGRTLLDRRAAVACSLGAVLLAVGGCLFGRQEWPMLAGLLPIGLGLATLSLISVCWLLAAGRNWTACAFAAAGFTACHVFAMGWVLPVEDSERAAVEFVRSIRQRRPRERLHVFAMGPTSLVYYAGEPVQRSESLQDLAREVGRGPAPVLTDERQLARLSARGESRVIDRLHSSRDPDLVALEWEPSESAAEPSGAPSPHEESETPDLAAYRRLR